MAPLSAQVHSCHFPATGRQTDGVKRPLSVRVELQHLDLVQQLLAQNDGNEALAAVVRAAWAVLLRCYTGLNEVCFGFAEVGGAPKASTADGSAAGLVSVMHISDDMSFEQLVKSAQSDETIVTATNDGDLQFNTSVLMRFGASSGGTTNQQVPIKTPLMSEKV